MKKNLKALCLLAGLVLAGCSNATSSQGATSSVAQSSVVESSVAPASSVTPSSTVESSVTPVSSSVAATVAYDLTGTVDFYGMYSVTAALKLYEGGTGDFTLTYTGTDPFTFNNANWSANADGTLTVNLTAVTAEGETSDVATTFYVSGDKVFGLYASNLGTVVISNVAGLSYVNAMVGTLDFYGMYSVTIKAEMLSDGTGLYTMDYGASGCMTIPTTWALDAETQALSFNTISVDPETSAVTYVPAAVYAAADGSFYCSKVATNLGELWITSSATTVTATLTGSVSVDYGAMGSYSVNDTLVLFADNHAFFYQDYGETGTFGAVYSLEAGEEENTFVIKNVFYSAEVIKDLTITLADGVYTASAYSGLGDVALTSAPAAETPAE